MKIGVLFCGYNSEDYVEDSLGAWVDRDDCVISAVSVPFLEYKNQEPFEDETTNILRKYQNEDKIQFLVDFPKFIKEHEARDQALNYLLLDGVDIVWLVDADEIYKTEEIDAIIKYVKENPACWYSLSLRNFVFDKNTYLKEPFCPPRIFQTTWNNLSDIKFYWDNDICYHDFMQEQPEISYEFLEKKDVPKEVAWIDHYSWLSDETSKRKVKYQMDHFGHCGYKWNEQTDLLEFNDEFYEKNDLTKPEVCSIV